MGILGNDRTAVRTAAFGRERTEFAVTSPRLVLIALTAVLALSPLLPTLAAEIMPHRALYTMTLGSTLADSGVVGATGAMDYEWGETCDGWTIEQRYRLKMRYAESRDVDVTSTFVTWESKDGLRYRFNQRQTRNGEVDQEVRGEAKLDGPGKGGTAVFTKPETQTLQLAPGVMFPSAHTILLIDKAKTGATFVTRQVFDGATDENAVQVSAVIGSKVSADPVSEKLGPLVDRPGWRVRLAFFPVDAKAEEPDYELGMDLLDNGVSRNMVIDYGDYSIRAKLDDIEPLGKPNC
jgi:envelope integrity protein B